MQQGTCRVHELVQHTGVGDVFASLQIVCAWCQQPLRRHQMQLPTRLTISYSICTRCYGNVARESAGSTGSPARLSGGPADREEGKAFSKAQRQDEPDAAAPACRSAVAPGAR